MEFRRPGIAQRWRHRIHERSTQLLSVCQDFYLSEAPELKPKP